MPSTLHQCGLLPFEDDPALAFDLIRQVFGVPMPLGLEITDRHAALSFGVPAAEKLGEVIADLILCGAHPANPRVKASVIVEAQRAREREKLIKFLLYLALTSKRFRRPAWLLVVALGIGVTTWLRNLPREYGGLQFQPLILERRTMPRVVTERAAVERPARALLSALIHAPWGDMEVARAAMRAIRRLDDETRLTYTRAVISAVPSEHDPTLQKILKETLTMSDRYKLGEVELKSVTYHKGLKKGRREGKKEGKIEGKIEGLIEQVLLTCELRNLPLDAETAAIIRSCKSIETLEQWRERAKRVKRSSSIIQ